MVSRALFYGRGMPRPSDALPQWRVIERGYVYVLHNIAL